MSTTITFDRATVTPATLAAVEMMLNAPAVDQIEREGFVIEQVPEPADLVGEIVLTQQVVQEALNNLQNAAAQILRLGRRMITDAENIDAPTFPDAVRAAREALGVVSQEVPAEGYASVAQLVLDLARWETYLENNGYGERRSGIPHSAHRPGGIADGAGEPQREDRGAGDEPGSAGGGGSPTGFFIPARPGA